MKKLLNILLSLALPAICTPIFGLQNQFYAGILGGYGSTNWGRLVTTDLFLEGSLPNSAKDAGFTYGVFIGDDINQNFGLEIRYQNFANSEIGFANNEYSPDGAPFTMVSKTSAFMFLGKLRAPITKNLQAYSIIGGSYTLRSDQIANLKGFGGVFGGGIDLAVAQHWHKSLEFDFVTGNANINEYPAQYYQPFLTAVVDKIIFYF